MKAWLIATAANPSADQRYRLETTLLLTSMRRSHGADLSPLHGNLDASDAKLRTWTQEFLIQQGDPFVLNRILAQCSAYSGKRPGMMLEGCLNPLARMGAGARRAMPWLLGALDKPDPDYMLITTLGYIGDRSVIPALVLQLQSTDDRNVSASLEALWRLHATESIPMIRSVATLHWYGPIRDFASSVAAALSGGPDAPVELALHHNLRPDSLVDVLSSYRQRYIKDCAEWRVGDRKIEGDDAIGTPANVLAQLHCKTQGAAFAIPFADGTLAGINKDEFGGGLLYLSRLSKRFDLSDANVVGLVPRGDGDALAFLDAVTAFKMA